MRIFILSFLFVSYLFSGVYYSKLEPVYLYNIKAAASGKVLYVNKKLEGMKSNQKIFIKLDDFINKKDLESSRLKLKFLQNTKKSLLQNLENSKKSERVKQDNYNRIKKLKTKSKFEKDNELINLLNAQNQVLSLVQSFENINIQIADLKYKIDSLKDTIDKKNIYLQKNSYIYKLYVKEGDYVNIGANLVDVYDTSKGKLTIFLSQEDMTNIEKKTLYIDGKVSQNKIDKIWKVADTENISSYRAEILVNNPKQFSKLVKIEIK